MSWLQTSRFFRSSDPFASFYVRVAKELCRGGKFRPALSADAVEAAEGAPGVNRTAGAVIPLGDPAGGPGVWGPPDGGAVDRGASGPRRVVALFFGATVVQAAANGVVAGCAGLLGQALVGRQLASSSALVDPPPL